jgi:hypothetical protein
MIIYYKRGSDQYDKNGHRHIHEIIDIIYTFEVKCENLSTTNPKRLLSSIHFKSKNVRNYQLKVYHIHLTLGNREGNPSLKVNNRSTSSLYPAKINEVDARKLSEYSNKVSIT